MFGSAELRFQFAGLEYYFESIFIRNQIVLDELPSNIVLQYSYHYHSGIGLPICVSPDRCQVSILVFSIDAYFPTGDFLNVQQDVLSKHLQYESVVLKTARSLRNFKVRRLMNYWAWYPALITMFSWLGVSHYIYKLLLFHYTQWDHGPAHWESLIGCVVSNGADNLIMYP